MSSLRFEKLKKRLMQADRFSSVYEHFQDHFDGDPAFASQGVEYHDEEFSKMIAEVVAKVLKITDTTVMRTVMTRIAEEQFIYGVLELSDGRQAFFFHFEEISQGLLAAGGSQGPDLFARLSLVHRGEREGATTH